MLVIELREDEYYGEKVVDLRLRAPIQSVRMRMEDRPERYGAEGSNEEYWQREERGPLLEERDHLP